MDNFITIQDYSASIHREILASLLREHSAGGQPNPDYDPEVIEICEDRAVAEMRSYLDKTARGKARHSLILMMALDITIYHIFCIHNPYKISDIRKERYERALEWLKGVSRGEITINGAPLLAGDERGKNSPWQIDAEDARPTLL